MTKDRIKQKFLFSYNEPGKDKPTQLYFLVYEIYEEEDSKLIEGLKNHLIQEFGEENVTVEEQPVTELDQDITEVIKEKSKTKGD